MTAASASNPIRTEWVTVPTAGGTMDAYLAVPPAGRGPGLRASADAAAHEPETIARQLALYVLLMRFASFFMRCTALHGRRGGRSPLKLVSGQTAVHNPPAYTNVRLCMSRPFCTAICRKPRGAFSAVCVSVAADPRTLAAAQCAPVIRVLMSESAGGSG